MLIPFNNPSPSILQELCATAAVQWAALEEQSSSLFGHIKRLENVLSQFQESLAAYEGNRLQKELLVLKVINPVIESQLIESQTRVQLFVDRLEDKKGLLSKFAVLCEGLDGDSVQSLSYQVLQVLRTAKEVQRHFEQSLETLPRLKASLRAKKFEQSLEKLQRLKVSLRR